MNIKALIKEGESETLELKKSIGEWKEIIETISAFANTRGGTILIGINEEKKVFGVQVGKRTIEDLTNKIRGNTDPKVFPRILVKNLDERDIIIIEVAESKSKPVFAFDRAYKRVGKSTVRTTSEEIRKMALTGKRIYWDEQICEEASLEDIDWKFVKEFFLPLYQEISKRKILGKPEEILESLGCMKSKKPINGGILLFGKNPQKFFINSYVALGRYKGKEVSIERLDYKEFDGNLFNQIDECNRHIKEHISIMSRLHPYQVRREDIPEYGLFSIRELITNAVCHRNYEDQHTKVIIKMFDDRIEFYNPGGLPQDITPKNITEKQFSRNPIIAKALAKVKYIEELGEGWDKIIKEHKEHPLKPRLPRIKSDRYTTIVTIFSTKNKFEKKKKIVELNDRQRRAIEYLKERGKITNREYVNLLQGTISGDTALNDLKDMVKKGIISIKRKGRGSYYVIR